MLKVKRDVSHLSNFEYFCLRSFLLSVLTSHSASNSRVPEVSSFVLTFFMLSEVQWTAVENFVFFSKPSIVIKLQVINMNFKFCSTSGNTPSVTGPLKALPLCFFQTPKKFCMPPSYWNFPSPP